MLIEAAFVRSAAGARDLPRDGLLEIALVGRSNVGKSSLINALVRQRIARTSAAPGKTRLANLYRVGRASGAGRATPFYLVDLPGYGYARGREAAAREFEELTRAYFGRTGLAGQVGLPGTSAILPPALAVPARPVSALLLVDARHPGLQSDIEAWKWLQRTVERCGIVATKIDKLARGERIRALRQFESVFEDSVLPASAVTGEGMDELWKVIEHLQRSSRPVEAHNRRNSSRASSNSSSPPAPTDRPPHHHRKSSSSRRSRT